MMACCSYCTRHPMRHCYCRHHHHCHSGLLDHVATVVVSSPLPDVVDPLDVVAGFVPAAAAGSLRVRGVAWCPNRVHQTRWEVGHQSCRR